MTRSVEEVHAMVTAMEHRFAEQINKLDKDHALHLLDCANRYTVLKDAVSRGDVALTDAIQRQGKVTLYAMTILAVIAVGLKSKFGEEFMRLLGLL